MRHKNIILVLAFLLVVLVIIKTIAPATYPLSINYRLGEEKKVLRLASKFIHERPDSLEKSIKWDSFSIGDAMGQMKKNSHNTTDTTIILAGEEIPCNTTYFYDLDSCLVEVHLYFNGSRLYLDDVTEKVKNLYGNNYMLVTQDSFIKRYFWICGNNIVFYHHHVSFEGLLCVANLSGLSDADLIKIIEDLSVIYIVPQSKSLVSHYNRD